MTTKTPNIILGSASPRRKELMEQMHLPCRVVTTQKEESYPENLDADEIAVFLAEQKAQFIKEEIKYNDFSNAILITADTTVIAGNQVLNKPANGHEAFSMLQTLSGSTHKVITGVGMHYGNKQAHFRDITYVTFKNLTDKEIQYYIDEFKPYDKAGAYAIQEWIGLIGITDMHGSYFNVMGLPVNMVYQQLLDWEVLG